MTGIAQSDPPPVLQAPSVPQAPPVPNRPVAIAAPLAPTPAQVVKAVVFRWFFVYWLIYFASAPLQILPVGYIPYVSGYIFAAYMWVQGQWRDLVVWVGKRVFDWNITVFPAGSGDTTFNYAELFTMAIIATGVAFIWTGIDFKRHSYRILNDLLRIWVRFALCATMLGYGLAKIFPGQFGAPGGMRLLQEYGDSSPMGLLWTFMGASAGYTILGGCAEALGGVLLFFRRTTLLGAMVSMGVMANVVALNFFYDVPVKLYSTHLLVAAMFLAAPDSGRLMKLLVLNKPAPPADLNPVFKNPWLKWPLFGVKLMIVAFMVGMSMYGQYTMATTWGAWAQRHALNGTWVTEKFVRDGQEAPPLLTDTERWRYLDVRMLANPPANGPAFMTQPTVQVRPMKGQGAFYSLVVEPEDAPAAPSAAPSAPSDAPSATPSGGALMQGTLEFLVFNGQRGMQPATGVLQADDAPLPAPAARLQFKCEPENRMTVRGTYMGKEIEVTLRKMTDKDFLLTNRPFNWINEYPFNR